MQFRIMKIAAILLFFLLPNLALASDLFQTSDNPSFVANVFTTENGLPQNTPTSIVQTKDGYIWLSTFGGLARFDGVKFTIFTTNSYPEIVSNRLTALYEDQQGALWIGSETGDLINYHDGKFTLIKKGEQANVENTIVSLYSDGDLLWIGSASGLKTYNLKTGEFTIFDSQQLLKNSLDRTNPLRIQGFAKDKENNLWIATSYGLLLFNDGKFTHLNETDGLPDKSLISLIIDTNDNLWLLSRKTLGKFKNGIFTDFWKADRAIATSSLSLNSNNHLFFTVGEELFEFSEKEILKFDISDVYTMFARSIVFDKEGNLWIGAEDSLIQLKKPIAKVFAKKYKGGWNPTYSIIQDNENTVWTTGVVDLLRWRNSKFDLVPLIDNKILYYASSLALDKNGALWIGTSKGILKFENDKITKFESDQIPEKILTALYFDKQGKFWIGGIETGLLEYHNGVFKTYTTKEGLPGNTIFHISEDSHGALWIGTINGLSRFENGQFTNFDFANGASTNPVRDVYEDIEGTVWIGTYGNGIIRLRDGKFTSITSKNGLPEDIASRILVDNADNFWILGNQGITSVSRKSLNDFADGKTERVFCSIYGKKDGMVVSEGNGGNQPAGWKTNDGRLWFPMIRGAIIINPEDIKQFAAPVYIEGIVLDQQKLNLRDKIEIRPGQENLEINYTAINFSKPDQVQFRYKLEGFDTDWQYVGSRRVAFYPYLPPGNYKFILSAVNGEIWSEKEAVLEITVYAPFWRTWWFYLIASLALTGVIVFIYQRRLETLKRRQQRQREFSRQLINAHESERQRIAVELHDGIGQALLVIKNWALLGLSESPQNLKVVKQLEEISETASDALDETRAIAHNLLPQHLHRFGLTGTIRNIITNISESSAINFETDIEDIDNLFSREAELSIYRIVQECLNNIIKHSEAQNASINIHRLPDKISMLIEDDGKGFKQSSQENEVDFGINNLIQRVELLGGKISIDSDPGKGTRIFIFRNIV